MKNGKRPTIKQRQLIKKCGLNCNNWLVTKNLPKELHITHRYTGNERVIRLVG